MRSPWCQCVCRSVYPLIVYEHSPRQTEEVSLAGDPADIWTGIVSNTSPGLQQSARATNGTENISVDESKQNKHS
jgi:hypothetical protein